MFLLDTDHISVLQWIEEPAFTHLSDRLDAIKGSDPGVTVISYHEQTIGWHALINRAKTDQQLARGYDRLRNVLKWYAQFDVLPFSMPAIAEFHRLRAEGVRIATLDLRIAAIAIAQGAILLTRNTADFSRVPGLRFEDWTKTA
ncbi:MAG: type II toxin-antitoxin system VapC family toxin [Phycisphaeraceae bacterium]